MHKVKKMRTTAVLAGLAVATMLTTAGAISVDVNGTQISFDAPPEIINQRTMVPMRPIFETLGAEVQWDKATRTVTTTRANDVMSLTIGSTTMKVNGSDVVLDVAPLIKNGRTFVPVRAISEALKNKVEWDANTKAVHITDNSGLVNLAAAKKYAVSNEEEASYKKAYAEVLRKIIQADERRTQYCYFDLCYIDKDDIPELIVADGHSHPGKVQIYTFVDKKAVRVVRSGSSNTSDDFYNQDARFGTYGRIYYKEKQNCFILRGGRHGGPEVTTYVSLNGTSVVTLKEYTLDDTSIYRDNIYTIDGKTVDKNTYENSMAQYGKDSEFLDSANHDIKLTSANIKKVLEN